MNRVRRYDFCGEIHFDARRNDGLFAKVDAETGFIHASARLTRTGVFIYGDSSGNTWGELRTDDEVFSAAAIESFNGVVITNDHPDEFIDKNNVSQHNAGHALSNGRRDGDHLVNEIVITDADAIADIHGGKKQLSCGYTVVSVADSGTLDGVSYTRRHTAIVGNHIAIVDRGRAGPSCSIPVSDTMLDTRNSKDSTMKKIKIDGKEVEVSDELALHFDAVNSKLEASKKLAEDAKNAFALELEKKKKAKAEADKKTATADSLTARIDSMEAAMKDRDAGESARMDARVALVTSAHRVLGASAKCDGISDIALMRDIILAIQPSLKARIDEHKDSQGYIEASYHAAIELHDSRSDSDAQNLNTLFETTKSDSNVESLDDARQAYLDRVAGKGNK